MLQGNVKIIYQSQFFEADQVEINLKIKQANLKGNVKIQATEYQMSGQEIQLDYEANQGLIYYGSVQSNNVRFQGDIIEKLSDTEFFVSNADYTTCSNCPATWSFDGSKIKAELGGYAYLKNTFMRVGGVPIVWLPYLIVPLKSERQTGLLTPEIGFVERRKLYFDQKLFWAISRSQDATITLRNYAIGGLKPAVEYRYVINEDSSGQINTSFLRDPLLGSDERFINYRQVSEQDTSYNRWSVRSYNQYSGDPYNKFQLKVNEVSDLRYPIDFNDEYPNYAESALESRLTYSHLMDHSLIMLDSSYYKNLLQADPLSPNTQSVHRLPELRFDSTYARISDSPFLYKVDSSFTRFYRGKSYDDLSTGPGGQRYVSNTSTDPRCENLSDVNCRPLQDGVYNENIDLLRTGQRFLLKTSVTTTAYNLAEFISLSPTVSYNEAQYLFDVGETRQSARRYLQFDLNTRTKFHRIYDGQFEITGNKYKNEIIPELQYTWVPWMQQDTHAFFGTTGGVDAPYASRATISDTDLNTPGGMLFDYEDRVYDRHIISLSLLDRLVRRKKEDNSYKTVVNFRLMQSYDLYQAQYGKNKDQPMSDVSATLLLDFDKVQSYSQVNYFPYTSETNSTTSVSYLNEKQQYIKLGYANKQTAPKQDDASFALGFVSNYINVLTGVVFDVSADRDNSQRLKKYSLITQLKPPGECWAINLSYHRIQKAILETAWNVTFSFSWDGKPIKVIPPSELNIN